MNGRREFLQKLGLSTLALSLSKYNMAASCNVIGPAYDGPVLRVAIMGLGSYGTRVAEAMQSCKQAKLVGAVSGTPAKIKNWQARYGIPEKNCYSYDTVDRIKDNPD